ncbi:hypothetical protein [Burkholderia multivorans]|uniref:hypothetical protein n=1 Tax=Burkholderia multivorans TaxID=87883 RepID=UPI0021BF9D52|nr:hypothetical protein [Burkholderia multivorans]MDR9052080.1 hypothetical protein [Burkholderia multivorans]MDR9060152.1 hypothetical protein [Burkholderia multivorans]MDR9062457.1 hypothetical protein [Burkholderia multivorans]MDR9072195.1 hypothetical protein [Burkholderia multivorans]MDR9076520.1 hypothetical protein [Burkholderia multivorans]
MTLRQRELTADEAARLKDWAADWLLYAGNADLIRPPYAPDDDQIERALTLYEEGATPEDAARAVFAPN